MRWWEARFQGEDGVGYRAFRHHQRFGARPAVMVIDVVRAFVGEPELTLAAVTEEWPTACGPAAHESLPHVAALLVTARRAAVPVIHTRPGVENLIHYGETVKGELAGDYGVRRPGAVDFLEESQPLPDELVVAKPKASAFFGTLLAGHLHQRGVDSILVAGATTSGCVRATVVDGFSWGFAMFVVEEAVFDRSPLSAAVSLYEMDAKYADVVSLEQARGWLREAATREPGPAPP